MIDAVFISDLHLHPEETLIQKRFDAFIAWAQNSVKRVYILGDFFHAWAGDDSLNDWSRSIAQQLFNLKQYQIEVFYLKGNRDFLLGRAYANRAGWTVLTEPTVIKLGEEKVLLVHGDGYCTKDRSHQRFRFLTRNILFTSIFLSLPLSFREKMVDKIRQLSLNGSTKSLEVMNVVSEDVVTDMKQHKVHTLIHGHTHKSGLTQYKEAEGVLKRYVLSDWDDNPKILCYDSTKGFYFNQIS